MQEKQRKTREQEDTLCCFTAQMLTTAEPEPGGRWEPATKSKLLHVAGKNSTTWASALHPKVHMPEELEWEQSQAWNPGPQSVTASGILMTGLNADP